MIHAIKFRKRTDEEYRRMNYYNVGTFYRIDPEKVATSCKTYGAELTAERGLKRR